MQLFSIPDLKTKEEREEVKSALRGRVWTTRVLRREEPFYLLEHAEFPDIIRLREKVIPAGMRINPGDELQVAIFLNFDMGFNSWLFEAKYAPTPDGMSTMQAIAVPHKKTVVAAPAQNNFGELLWKLNVAGKQADTTSFRIGPEISIYIDECWPGIVSPDMPQDTGVLAGIVWNGPRPEPGALPLIRTHLSRDHDYGTIAQALTTLLKCRKAFPFVLPITTPGESAHAHYIDLVRAGIKILLGWLLAPSLIQHKVTIYLEQFSSMANRFSLTDYFKGMLDEVGFSGSRRFIHWEIERVIWEGKEFEYIPYGDLLAWPVHEHTSICKKIAAASGYTTWPGYFPLSLALLPKLMRLDSLAELRNMDDLLDILYECHGTKLCGRVQQEAAQVIAKNGQLQKELVEALGKRYSAKERDLNKLRKILSGVAEIVDLSKGSPAIRLLWALIRMQAANHDGDPRAGEQLLALFRDERSRLIETDRLLVATADLNYIVHLNDLCRWEEARDWNAAMVRDPSFSYLDPKTRGQILSSYGQCLSMAGERIEADASFAAALAEFEKQRVAGDALAGETDQTTVYRAINAMDADCDGFQEAFELLLGATDSAVDSLATAGFMTRQYHHHLLVRALWFRGELGEARRRYLSSHREWQDGLQHPWELIDLYRALLAFHEHADPDAGAVIAKEWFDRGIEIAEDGVHGATLLLISAIIAAVADCCIDAEYRDGKKYGEHALTTMKRACEEVPAATPILRRVEIILQSPSPDRVNELLTLLPFNYH